MLKRVTRDWAWRKNCHPERRRHGVLRTRKSVILSERRPPRGRRESKDPLKEEIG